MENITQKNLVTITIDEVSFHLKENHNFLWLKNLGNVFCVFDQQDSGNISFGIENNGEKFFVKFAGAKPEDFSGDPLEAVDRLIKAIPVYKQLEHPYLIKLIDHFSIQDGYAAVFEWFEGECLHSHWSYGGKEKYTNPKSPYYRFRILDIEKRLEALDKIFSFHAFVETQGFVAVDFYDGSILYNFSKDEMKICDIDFYRKSPSVNELGKNFWGVDRSKSPEEYVLGAPIDSITNVFNMGAIAFGLLGGERDHSLSKWEANQNLYKVAIKAVEKNRDYRYPTINKFYEAWKAALGEKGECMKSSQNLEKYADPEMYDHLYDKYQKDLGIILKWANQDHPILELACGTGRLTIPMAQRGFQMVGVDLHEGMLERARRKAEQAEVTIEFMQQDCTKLNLPVRSSLAFMTGNSYQHFLTNEAQDALFQSVRRHLVDGGIFIFDTRNPVLKELFAVDEYEEKYVDKNGDRVIESHRDVYDHLTQILDCRTHRRIYRDNTLIAEEQDGISLRYSFPQEMERLVAANGFEIVQVYGDWDENELHAESVSMVYICRVKTE